ncbi:MAG: helix-turn-helix transcriptional regulator [Oscillospiraceae bacterium]|nr:helix-turn-helix transcriptional regulator [Oscillospiraceae bacterium]
MRNKDELYDFRSLGQAIKSARLKRGMTRDEAADIIHIDPRYLTNIENKGQHPSLQIFYKLVTLFNISVDQFFYPNVKSVKNTRRRQLDYVLDNLDEKALIIIEIVADGITKANENNEMGI